MYGKPRKTKAQMVADVAAAHPGAVIAYAHKDASKRNTLKYGIRVGDFIEEYLRYQDTDIIKWCANGNVVLDSGGWKTVTTKARFNEHLNFIRVWQERGVWYVTYNGTRYEYYDGMTITPEGITDIGTQESDRVKMVTKQINRYCLLITDDNLPTPNAGDCWYCSMIGDNDDLEHLVAHMEEGYVHGSILVNAMRDRGYNDDQIGVHYSMKIGDTFRRAVRRYLKRRFGIGG